jgi:phosphoribosyl 1,2-cyclic phosphodiesterase
MPLFIASLNSGSNANCYYIGNESDALLVDAGLSCRETEKRMKRLGLDMKNIKAIFISHEHADHIAGLPVIAKKFNTPVYITNATMKNSGLTIDPSLTRNFHHQAPVTIGTLQVTAFSKSHDAADPYSFLVSAGDISIGVITDIGYACSRVKKHFSQCDAVFLESNYCEQMLENGSYPQVLKKRISGRKGHLSNDQALELFLQHRHKKLQLLILSHLSQNNNHPETVNNLFQPHAGEVKIVIASRYKETELFAIQEQEKVLPIVKKRKQTSHKLQLSLFTFEMPVK